MGIYIPGMEMPTRCAECRLSTVHSFNDRPLCDLLVEYMSYGEWETKRLDNCPLVPVPPHGRLGDLDALVDWLKLSYGTSIPIVRGLLFSSIIKEIQEYPSVIPAEQKSKEEDEAK